MTDIPEDVMKMARAVVAQRFMNLRDRDFAVWIIEGTAQPYPTEEIEAAARAILAERERCAKVAESFHNGMEFSAKHGAKKTRCPIAAAIRKGE